MCFRFAIASLCLLGACAARCGGQTSSPRLARLPEVIRIAQANDAHPEGAVQAEAGDSLSFGAGAVQLSPIRDWWIREVPQGRDIFLVMSPEPPKRLPDDGIWLTYHVAEPTTLPVSDELRGKLLSRLRATTDRAAKFSEASEFQIDSWPGIAVEFLIPASSSTPPLQGRHVLVRTDWGIFELHASAPRDQFDARSAMWAGLWKSIRLEAPKAKAEPVAQTTRDAAAVVGSWKSYRSRMRLRGNGTIEIVPDSVNLLIDPNSPQLLRGTYQARGDLLYVTWTDGSRLNFRWRSRQGDLFLTDHEGQISQLKRLLE